MNKEIKIKNVTGFALKEFPSLFWGQHLKEE